MRQTEGTVNSLNIARICSAAPEAQLNQASMEASLVDGGDAAAKSNVAALQLLKLAVLQVHGHETGCRNLLACWRAFKD